MEEFAPLLALIAFSFALSALAKAKGNAGQGKRTGRPSAGSPTRANTSEARRSGSFRSPWENQSLQATEKTARSSQAASSGSTASGSLQLPDEDPTQIRHVPIQPTLVSQHLEDADYGSLPTQETEGFDPCHDEQLSEMDRAEAAQPFRAAGPVSPGLGLSWASGDIVKGFVYGEILKHHTPASGPRGVRG